MAEDQGVNGTIWNKEAIAIFSKFGWGSIGDIDMDIKGDDDKSYGVDSLLKISSPLSPLPLLAILEAKRYATTSFSASILQQWVDRLDQKLNKLKFSEEFKYKFPIVDDCRKMNIAIIAIWFHDIREYQLFQDKFMDSMKNLQVSNRTKKGGYNKILIIDNMIIMKLCSLYQAIESYKKEKKSSISFLYPSTINNGKATDRSNIISLEYITSKVILAEAKDDKGNKENIVFYFGLITLEAFKLLREQLSGYSVLDKERSLVLYLYDADIEYRKIKPEIEKIFSDVQYFSIKMMDSLTDLPGDIKTIGHE